MNEKNSGDGIKPYITLICALAATVCFIVYLCLNYLPEETPEGLGILFVIWTLFSFAGLASAYVTREYCETHRLWWWIGTVLSVANFMVALFFIGAIIILVSFLGYA